jgi:peptide/nickel transport system permease protein
MSIFLARRFVTFLITLFGASILVFLLLEVLPGDPALTILGVDAPDSAVEALRKDLGLERPAVERYLDWIAGLSRGEMGNSYTYQVPVSELIAERLEVTVPLGLGAMVLATILALSMGLYAASRHNKAGDYGVMAASQLGLAIPNFWLGIMLIVVFSLMLGWAPSGGFPRWEEDFGKALGSLVLPVAALGFTLASLIARLTRSAVLDALREDYVRTARAKGLSRGAALRGHVLRNALIPIITILGIIFADAMAGTIIIENVFSLPGLGKLIFGAISNRDLMVVKNAVLLLAALVVVVNFVVDVLYAIIDPRIRLGS